jgi:uncharacterized membrane protein YobD (UPF0266 family)
MAQKVKDITEYCNPFTECGDVLHVNINKKRTLMEGTVVIGIFFSISVLLFVYGFWVFGMVAFLIAVLLFFVYRNMFISVNPKMTIDKQGIVLDNNFYRWSEIHNVDVTEGQVDEGSDYLNIRLKNNRTVTLTLDAYLDQRVTTIANYIVKYFR